MSLRIGILQTDSVLPQFQAEHGNYPSMFEALFKGVNATLEFTTYDVQKAVPTVVDCDAYLITGSRHSVYEELAWIGQLAAFVERTLAADRKIMGICFGHQLMAHFFGGHVAAHDEGWAVGVHHSQVVAQQPWMPDTQDSFALLSSHQDQVQALPAGGEVYLSNDFCRIAGYTVGDQVITVQSHPEFSANYARTLLDHRRELYGEALYGRSIASLDEPTSEREIARWLLAFAGVEP